MARSTGTPKTGRRGRQRAATAHNRPPEGATPSPATIPGDGRANRSDQGAPRSGGHRWVKGQSGNPAGRPKIVESIRDLARQHGDAAIRELAALLGNQNPKIRLEAAGALLDRGFGRPSQSLELSLRREDLATVIANLTPEERRLVAQGDLRPLAKA